MCVLQDLNAEGAKEMHAENQSFSMKSSGSLRISSGCFSAFKSLGKTRTQISAPAQIVPVVRFLFPNHE